MFRVFLFLFCVFASSAYAQTERYIETVDLTKPENRPFYSRTHSLPLYVAEGVLSGKITAYTVDYASNTILPLTISDYKKTLIFETADYGYGEVDTFPMVPGDLKKLKLDISKGEKQRKINYIHFSAEDYKTGLIKYYFSVSFDELAQYLDQQNAIWVKSASPLVWKGQILHTNGDYISDIIYDWQQEGLASYLHLVTSNTGEYEKLLLYDHQHQLLAEEPFSTFTSNSGEVRLMSQALSEVLYTLENEEKLNTTIPEASGDIKNRKLKDGFVVTFVEDIHLKRPENAKFFQEDKELSTLIMRAVESGLLSDIYTNDSLNARMSLAEWQYNASEEVMSDTGGWEDESSDDEITISRHMYTARSVSIVSVSWKVHFNAKGEVLTRVPHAIGLLVAPEETITGLSKLLGYFSFDDINRALTDKCDCIEDLKNGNYFSYWRYTSGIAVSEDDK